MPIARGAFQGCPPADNGSTAAGAHSSALACPPSWESTRAHPAATGIWGVLRCLASTGTPGLAKAWRQGGGHGAAFFMGERSEKGLSLFLCTLVSTQEHENTPEQICSVVLGIMTQRFFIPLPVTHPVQPHGPDSEQPNLFGLPLPKIPLNICPLQSAVKNSGDFSLPSPPKQGWRERVLHPRTTCL